MGRIRTIKPEFPQSESMGRVSREARLCFILLWTLVDDCGRTRGSSRMLASLLYPYDDDAPALIDGWLSELEKEKCLERYEIDNNCYVQICKWNSHQKIDHASPSRLPAPRESSRILAPDLVPSTLTIGSVPSTEDHIVASSPTTIQLTPPEAKSGKKKNSSEFILPEWVPIDLWEIWVENRKAIKKPLNTNHAKNLAVGRLESFRAQGYDIAAVLNEAILKNWIGLFVSKDTPKISQPRTEKPSLTEAEAEASWEQAFAKLGMGRPNA